MFAHSLLLFFSAGQGFLWRARLTRDRHLRRFATNSRSTGMTSFLSIPRTCTHTATQIIQLPIPTDSQLPWHTRAQPRKCRP